MPLLVRALPLELDEPESLLIDRAARRLRVDPDQIRTWAILRKSIDARRNRSVRWVYNIELTLHGPAKREANLVQRLHRQDVRLVSLESPPELVSGNEPLPERPIVVGFGPGGMFAGLQLARHGYRPLIFERGAAVQQRHRAIYTDFYRHRTFHEDANLVFGEGGAGTYSDGKLYTRVNDARIESILQTFYQQGASPEILTDGRPHIGSDRLPGICRGIREEIESLGGEVRFNAMLDDVRIENGRLVGVTVNGSVISAGPVVLAIGQSGRDSMRMLSRRGIVFETKPFQMGVRIEHPQELVDQWQYGSSAGHPALPPADYQLVAKGAAGERGNVFSFCMCPGGMLLPTNQSPGLVCTNGGSRHRRDSGYANSALVVTLNPDVDCPGAGEDPLRSFDFLEAIEQHSFEMAGGDYRIPLQRASDFVRKQRSDGQASSSYPLGSSWLQLHDLLPDFVGDAIARALRQLDQRMKGFAGRDALLACPETRASCPVRLVRNRDDRQAVSAQNLYPVGEGAGYAGGIISAALDGIRTADAIISRYAPR